MSNSKTMTISEPIEVIEKIRIEAKRKHMKISEYIKYCCVKEWEEMEKNE